jgi:hypothetical protein
MIVRSRSRIFSALAVLGVIAACAAPGITDAPTRTSANILGGGAPTLLQCPVATADSTTAVVGPLGGLLSIAGAAISIPPGALLAPVQMTVTVPASDIMEIDISVAGSEHFVFETPVVVTVSYARCGGSFGLAPLKVWYIDSDTQQPLEQMLSIDNRLLKTITFVTPHLSGYAVAN